MKINILIDNKHSFLNNYKIEILRVIKNENHQSKFYSSHNSLEKGDVLFILGCDKILKSKKLELHHYNLVIHPSKLPRGRGGASFFWEILKNKSLFYITMFNANSKIDAGQIVLIEKFKLRGNELHDELRYVQAKKTIKLIKRFLQNIKKVKYNLKTLKFKKQIGKPSFYRKRTAPDSELDINKSIRENFNLLRISSNIYYPAFFKYKNKKFIIKIYEENY